MINVDISNIWGELSLPDLLSIEQEIAAAHAALTEDPQSGCWLELPSRDHTETLTQIRNAAQSIRADSEVCVVVGAGSCCTGARAVVDLLGSGTESPRMLFAGSSLSTRHWNDLVRQLHGRDFSVIVISEDDGAMESAIAFRGLRWILERRYGTEECSRRIYLVSGPGALRQLGEDRGWTCFSLPAGISGPSSVFTPAGLLPMAVAGISVEALLSGAAAVRVPFDLRSFDNPVWLYTAVRCLMQRRGKAMELLAAWEPAFRRFGDWWQQLFCSCGKPGLFPVPVQYPADLHSLGRAILGSPRNYLETMVQFDPPEQPHIIGSDVRDPEGLNHLADKQLAAVEEEFCLNTLDTHADCGIPVVSMECGSLEEGTLGALLYFLQLSCGIASFVTEA